MKCLKLFICLFLIVSITPCFSAPPKKKNTPKEPETKIYFYKNPSTDFFEIESIGLSTKSPMVIYSIERNEATIMMEIGSYWIADGIITIKAGKFQATGTITDEKIVINDKVYLNNNLFKD